MDGRADEPLTWHHNLLLVKRSPALPPRRAPGGAAPSPPGAPSGAGAPDGAPDAARVQSLAPHAPYGAPPRPPPPPGAARAAADVWASLARGVRGLGRASLAWRAPAPAAAPAGAAPAPRPQGQQRRASYPAWLQLLFGEEPAGEVAPDGPDAAPGPEARSRRSSARTWRLREQPMPDNLAWLEPYRFAKRLPVKRSNFHPSANEVKPEQLDFVMDDPAFEHRLRL
jgi:hypothetical protein